jgi:hypothetical protein
MKHTTPKMMRIIMMTTKRSSKIKTGELVSGIAYPCGV